MKSAVGNRISDDIISNDVHGLVSSEAPTTRLITNSNTRPKSPSKTKISRRITRSQTETGKRTAEPSELTKTIHKHEERSEFISSRKPQKDLDSTRPTLSRRVVSHEIALPPKFRRPAMLSVPPRHKPTLPVPVPNLTKKSRGRRVPTELMRTETPARIRTYVCSVTSCGKCFQRGEHLKRHIRSIHTDDKPFKCSHRDCDKYFSRSDNLMQHLRVVHRHGDESSSYLKNRSHESLTPESPDSSRSPSTPSEVVKNLPFHITPQLDSLYPETLEVSSLRTKLDGA